MGVLDGKHCVDMFRSIGVFDLELTAKSLAELVEPIIIAFSKLLIFD